MGEVRIIPTHPVYGAEDMAALGLFVPQLSVMHVLDTRLARHGRELQFNHAELAAGTRQLELEQQIGVVLDSTPKGSEEDEPQIDYPEAHFSRHTSVHLVLNPETVTDKNAARLANTALWLGVLVADQLAQGKDDDFEQAMSKSKHRRSIGNWVVSIGVGMTDDVLAAVDAIHESASIEYGSVALQVATYAVLAIHQHHQSRHDELTDFIEKEFKDKANDMGKQHPVIDYEFTRFTAPS